MPRWVAGIPYVMGARHSLCEPQNGPGSSRGLRGPCSHPCGSHNRHLSRLLLKPLHESQLYQAATASVHESQRHQAATASVHESQWHHAATASVCIIHSGTRLLCSGTSSPGPPMKSVWKMQSTMEGQAATAALRSPLKLTSRSRGCGRAGCSGASSNRTSRPYTPRHLGHSPTCKCRAD